MFRRRSSGRRRWPRQRGLVSRLTGQPAPQPILIEANRRFETGDYAAAAGQYEQMALSARRPRNAAHLLVQAGQAWLMAGQTQQAVTVFRRGLELLAERGRWLTFQRLGRGVVQALRERGQNQSADEFAAWLNGQPLNEPGPASAAPTQAPARPKRLPLKCPSCGGAIDPRDVEWVDESTVECDYCGSLIRAEEG